MEKYYSHQKALRNGVLSPSTHNQMVFFCDLKTFIWSINSDIFHIVCTYEYIPIYIYQFAEYVSHSNSRFSFRRVLESVKRWPLCRRYCIANFIRYSYQLFIWQRNEKLMNMFALELNESEKGECVSKFIFLNFFHCVYGSIGQFDGKQTNLMVRMDFEVYFWCEKKPSGGQTPTRVVSSFTWFICAQRYLRLRTICFQCVLRRYSLFICVCLARWTQS